MSKLPSVKRILNNESGIAIVMVTSAIAILIVVLAEFTFETNLNKIRVENQVDRLQAKLNAQAGVNFALAKLDIYKEAWNTLENNENMKKTISPSDLEKVVTQPFVYPIPVGKNLNVIQRNAIEEFEKGNLIQGGLSIAIKPVTGFLNPNSLIDPSDPESRQSIDPDDKDDKNPINFIEKQFTEMIEKTIQDKIETDEDFAIKYSNLDYSLLVKELKYYVNHPNYFTDDSKSDLEKQYDLAGIKPKHAPMESIEELYTLQMWDDELVNLFKDRMSIHQVSVININEITQNQLKVLFPDMTEFQLEEFFKKRDGDQEQETEPTPFKTQEDFKKLIVDELGVLSSGDYDSRLQAFEKARITLGVAAKLFEIISIGTFNDTTYQLTAYADLPVQPPKPQKKKNDGKGSDGKGEDGKDGDGDDGQGEDDPPPEDGQTDSSKKKTKTILLQPRIVEMKNN